MACRSKIKKPKSSELDFFVPTVTSPCKLGGATLEDTATYAYAYGTLPKNRSRQEEEDLPKAAELRNGPTTPKILEDPTSDVGMKPQIFDQL